MRKKSKPIKKAKPAKTIKTAEPEKEKEVPVKAEPTSCYCDSVRGQCFLCILSGDPRLGAPPPKVILEKCTREGCDNMVNMDTRSKDLTGPICCIECLCKPRKRAK